MNELVNKFLLAGDIFKPEMQLKQQGLSFCACGPFKETGDTNYIYKNWLDKTCFQHDMTYGDFKDL